MSGDAVPAGTPGLASRPPGAAEPSVHLQKLVRSGGLSVVGAGVSAVAGVGLVAVLTQGLSKDLAGTIFATTALFLIGTAVVQLGAEVGVVRYLPMQLATGRLRDVRPTLRTALLPVGVAAVVVGLVAVVVAPLVAPRIAGEEHAATVTAQLRVLAAFLPLAALYNVVLAATRGCRTMRPTVAVESLGRNLVQLLTVGAAVLGGAGAAVVVLAWSVPYALGLAASVWWLLRLLRRVRPAAAAAPAPQEEVPAPAEAARDLGTMAMGSDPSSFWRYTAPRAVANVAQTLLKRSDIVLVAALRSPAEAALYTAATRFVVFGQLGVQALQQALAPQLSALFARGERDDAQDLYETATAWSIMLAWPVYLACAVLAPLLLSLFGSGYEGASAVVVILSVAMLMATASGSVDTVLLMSGRSSLSLANVGAALVVNLGLNVVLIPSLGIKGAALAWAAAIVVRNVLPLLEIRYLLRMSPLGSGTVWVGTSALACLGLVPGTLRVLGASQPVLVASLVVGTLAYLALLWVGRDRVRLAALSSTLLGRRGRAGGRRGGGRAGARTAG